MSGNGGRSVEAFDLGSRNTVAKSYMQLVFAVSGREDRF